MVLLSLILLNLSKLLWAIPAFEYQVYDKQGFVRGDGILVHATETELITRSSLSLLDSADHFFIQLAPGLDRAQLSQLGAEILLYKTNEYAIVRVTNQAELQDLAHRVHDQGGFCGGLQKLGTRSIILEEPQLAAPLRELRSEEDIAQRVDKVSRERIVATVQMMESWQTRHHQDANGQLTAERLATLYQSVLPSEREDVTIELVSHRGSPQPSLRVRVLGSQSPEQIYVLGSHLDSINPRDNKNAPGADDNASGTATNFEIFRQLMAEGVTLAKTLEIHAYGAEEIGLLGSKEMAESYRGSGKAVQAMVQFDMNGYTRDRAQFHFVSNNTNKALSDSLAKLVDLYIGLPWQHSRLVFGSSDHASWHKMGFAVAFPTENPMGFNRKIHTDEDTLGNINSPEQMRAFAQLGLAFVLHYLGSS